VKNLLEIYGVKNGSEQGKRRYFAQCSDPMAMQQRSDLQLLDEGRNSVLHVCIASC
jgi:hypothetical protein